MNTDLIIFGQVVLVDLVLAGDNAVVVGALAASLPAHQRRIAILAGVGLAVVARIVLSIGVMWILKIPAIKIVGGAMLFWVAWKMWKDMRQAESDDPEQSRPTGALHNAIIAILLADLSMSLDNVLGVAGAAAGHTAPLAFGLVLSVVLMGVAASLIAALINKYRWIGYVGLSLIVFIAASMVWQGISAYGCLILCFRPW